LYILPDYVAHDLCSPRQETLDVVGSQCLDAACVEALAAEDLFGQITSGDRRC
jgi:hypothetical protein